MTKELRFTPLCAVGNAVFIYCSTPLLSLPSLLDLFLLILSPSVLHLLLFYLLTLPFKTRRSYQLTSVSVSVSVCVKIESTKSAGRESASEGRGKKEEDRKRDR